MKQSIALVKILSQKKKRKNCFIVISSINKLIGKKTKKLITHYWKQIKTAPKLVFLFLLIPVILVHSTLITFKHSFMGWVCNHS